MSARRYSKQTARAAMVLGLLLGAVPCLADEARPDAAKFPATCASPNGTMLRRPSGTKDWKLVKEKEGLPTGDLLVGGPGGMLDSANGAVHLTMLTDLSGTSPFPVIESALALRANPEVDLDFTLDRGRVDLINRKDKGPAHVRVHVRDASWDLTLTEPGARIALELYGRWPRGVPFTKEPGPKDVPLAQLVFLVLQGEVAVKHQSFQHTLSAPPGPALMEWDSVTGHDETPQHLKELPAWATATDEDTPETRKKKAVRQQFSQLLTTKSVDVVLDELLDSKDPAERRLAVFAMGALDDLPRLGKALSQSKHPDVWDNGVLALRHWLGRGPGQDQKLYQGLMEKFNYTPVQAETVLQLLHSFSDEDLAQPETYQTLIDYLDHDKLAIRGLAYWHLSRLAPAGRKLGYSPHDSKEERQAAVKKWRNLLPPGKVPSRFKTEDKR